MSADSISLRARAARSAIKSAWCSRSQLVSGVLRGQRCSGMRALHAVRVLHVAQFSQRRVSHAANAEARAWRCIPCELAPPANKCAPAFRQRSAPHTPSWLRSSPVARDEPALSSGGASTRTRWSAASTCRTSLSAEVPVTSVDVELCDTSELLARPYRSSQNEAASTTAMWLPACTKPVRILTPRAVVRSVNLPTVTPCSGDRHLQATSVNGNCGAYFKSSEALWQRSSWHTRHASCLIGPWRGGQELSNATCVQFMIHDHSGRQLHELEQAVAHRLQHRLLPRRRPRALQRPRRRRSR